MKIKKFKDKEKELLVRIFGNEEWEAPDVVFRILNRGKPVGGDVSLTKKQVRKLVKFLENWVRGDEK